MPPVTHIPYPLPSPPVLDHPIIRYFLSLIVVRMWVRGSEGVGVSVGGVCSKMV